MAFLTATESSSGSSGRIVGAEKHEIYGTAFGGHLFYDIFTGPGAYQSGPPSPDPLLESEASMPKVGGRGVNLLF